MRNCCRLVKMTDWDTITTRTTTEGFAARITQQSDLLLDDNRNNYRILFWTVESRWQVHATYAKPRVTRMPIYSVPHEPPGNKRETRQVPRHTNNVLSVISTQNSPSSYTYFQLYSTTQQKNPLFDIFWKIHTCCLPRDFLLLFLALPTQTIYLKT